ncbi:hypothetical protein ISF86_12200 [Burkholderia pseudomallei]|uniref:hypothetical protein n=1 Tax=Burkholderia pseudomallei TaxID=28450 RepID=UPI000A1A25DB|nr:hypothetical protein [Burkholderia pseudomallei]ARL52457.1 hypothetical protein BOC51_21110 [Burkholderia pseudomallei]MBF3650499.1 hypothetical protein [Burkholderia pseudomallei]
MTWRIEESLQRSIESAALSAASKEDAAQLTDSEKFALAVLAGIPFDTVLSDAGVHYEICGHVGFEKVDGQWQVYHRRVSHV